MSSIIGTFNLVDAMREEGFPLPTECREARLILGVNEAFMIQYDVFLTDDTLEKLGRALIRCVEKNREAGRG